MTFLTPQCDFDSTTALLPSQMFAINRSLWLDTFSDLENSLFKFLMKFDNVSDAKKSSFSERLKTLAKIEPSAQMSKERLKNLATLSTDLAPEIHIRNSLVHGKMTLGEHNQLAAAMFQNTADAAQGFPSYLIMTEIDFKCSREKLSKTSDRLIRYLTPPSPPQPSPGAAAGP